MQPIYTTGEGLTEEIVRAISAKKEEPEWMLEFRLKSLEAFHKMPMQTWGPDLSDMDFDKINYYQNQVINQPVIGMMCQIKSKKLLNVSGFQKQNVNI